MDNKSDNVAPNGQTKMSDTVGTYEDVVLSVIDREYGSLRNGAKILARHAKSSIDAAKNWIYGRRVPTGEALVNIMAENDAMYAEIIRIIMERRIMNSPEREK